MVTESHCPGISNRVGRLIMDGKARRPIPGHIIVLRTKGGMMLFLLPFALGMVQTGYDLDEIVVTATRYPAMLQDIMVATAVIEQEDIEYLQPQVVGDVLQMYSGLEIKDIGLPGAVSSIFIRGVPSSGTLVLLDGQPLNAVTTGMADLSLVNVNFIERIEIVKGPVSSVYGANALGGVVHLITSGQEQHPNIRLGTVLSTTDMKTPWQSHELFASLGVPAGRTSLTLSGVYDGANGIRSNSDLARYQARARIGYQGERIDLSFSGTYDNKEHGVPGPLPLIDEEHAVPELGDSTATSLYDRQHDIVVLGSAAVTWHPHKRLMGSSMLAFSQKEMTYITTYAGGISGEAITDRYDYSVYSFGVNTMLMQDLTYGTIAGGIDLSYDSLAARKRSLQTGDLAWDAGVYCLGGWGEMKFDLLRQAKIIASMRVDEHDLYGLFISPTVGGIYTVVPDIVVKMSAGKTYRSPTFNDLYWPAAGDPDLDPEHGWMYEVRLERVPAAGWCSALSCYLRDIHDRVAWLPGDDRLWHPQNVNRLIIKGIDISLAYRGGHLVQGGVEGTIMKAVQRNDEIIYDSYDWSADTGTIIIDEVERKAAFIPDLKFSGYLNIMLSADLVVSLNGIFSTSRVNYYMDRSAFPVVSMDTKVLDRYYVLQVAASKTFGNRLTLHLGIKNLLDEQYATQFGNVTDDLDYPMPGRTFFAKMTSP